MSELKTLKMKDGKSMYESIDSIVANTASRDNSLPLLVILSLPEKKEAIYKYRSHGIVYVSHSCTCV